VPDLLLRRPPLLLSGCRDAELGPAREPGAVEHLRPGEPERAHHGHAAVPHRLAQRPAGTHRPAELRQTHRGEERAQELLGVPVAQLGDEGQPGRRLLLGLPQRVVAQQVGDPHVPVAHPVAQRQGARDGSAHRAHRRAEPGRRRPELGGRRRVGGAESREQQHDAERGDPHGGPGEAMSAGLGGALLPGLDPRGGVNKRGVCEREGVRVCVCVCVGGGGVNEKAGASASPSTLCSLLRDVK